MTSMAAEYRDNCSSYVLAIWKQLLLEWIWKNNLFKLKYIFFHREIMLLTPTTIDKWPPRNSFEMLDLENG